MTVEDVRKYAEKSGLSQRITDELVKHIETGENGEIDGWTFAIACNEIDRQREYWKHVKRVLDRNIYEREIRKKEREQNGKIDETL